MFLVLCDGLRCVILLLLEKMAGRQNAAVDCAVVTGWANYTTAYCVRVLAVLH